MEELKTIPSCYDTCKWHLKHLSQSYPKLLLLGNHQTQVGHNSGNYTIKNEDSQTNRPIIDVITATHKRTTASYQPYPSVPEKKGRLKEFKLNGKISESQLCPNISHAFSSSCLHFISVAIYSQSFPKLISSKGNAET